MSSVTKRPHQQAFTQHDEAGPVVEVPTKHRRCSECGATSTPQWRQGPSGPQTLCNACGVRYSRLTRRVKMPKRQHSEFSSQDDMQDVMQDSGSEDTSKGTTILMTAPSTPALGTATCAPAVQLSPMSALTTQHTYPAGSPIRLARAVRTSSNLLNIAPCSPAGVATPPASTNNSRRSSTGGSTLPFNKAELPVSIKAEVHLLAKASVLDSPRQKARFMEKPPHEDEDLDCQAALNLLSMAAGPPCREGGSPHTPPVGSSPAGPTSPFGGLAAAVQHQATRAVDAGLSRQPSSASAATIASPPAVSSAEVKALQQLCAVFDQRFKDLVAARAACEAVSRVLLVKQEEARAAQHAARQAAKALMLHAQDLSCHEDVVKAISHASVLAKQQDDQQPLPQPEAALMGEAALITDVQPHSVDSSSSSTPAPGQVLPEPTTDMAASQ